MLYELHNTIDHKGHSQDVVRDWIAFCRQQGWKPLDIRLHGVPDHENERQVMMAAVHEGDDDSMRRWVAQAEWDANLAGFDIIRRKVEVPLDKSAPYKHPRYFEAHVKSLLPADIENETVERCVEAGWVASYNALYTEDWSLAKWYFTQRSYPLESDVPTFIQAARNFNEGYDNITTLNWHTVRLEKETVIVDTNPSLDEGWA